MFLIDLMAMYLLMRMGQVVQDAISSLGMFGALFAGVAGFVGLYELVIFFQPAKVVTRTLSLFLLGKLLTSPKTFSE